jgi:hypothetical protein
MMLDLYDWEVGASCSLCSNRAEIREGDVGPVCSDCMVELLRAERFLRDSVGPDGRAVA